MFCFIFRERERERDQAESSGAVTKTVRVMKTSQRSVPHPLQDEIDAFSTSEYSTLKSNGYPSIQRDYQLNEKLYGSSKHLFIYFLRILTYIYKSLQAAFMQCPVF